MVALPSAIAAASALSELCLPEAPVKPWRFQRFPIAAWWGPPGTSTRADFEAYRDAGFNLHATNLDTGFDEALRHIEAVGLHSITLRDPGDFELPPRPDPVPPENHPSIVGWIVTDEPNGEAVPGAITQVNALMRRDPTRWAFFNLLPPNLQAAPGTAGVLGAAVKNGMRIASFDDYEIFDDGTDRPGRFYGNLATVRDAALANDVPLWAFAVTIRHAGYAGIYRRPSESDLRWMQFSNLAYGAKGLWYFTYWGATTLKGFSTVGIVRNDGTRSELYDMARRINFTVIPIGDTLLRLRSVAVHHGAGPLGRWIDRVSGASPLVGFLEDTNGDRYAWVVNKRHGMGLGTKETADTLTLTFAPGVREVEAVSWLDGKTGPLALRGGQATLEISGGTGVLLRAPRDARPAR